MDRGDATLVQRVGIGAFFDEVGDHFSLSIVTSVGGVVERPGSPSVRGARVRAPLYEQLGYSTLLRGSGDVQCRVTAVDVVADLDEEVLVWIFAGCANLNRTACKLWCPVQQLCGFVLVSGSDCAQ
jgi:hypothetical protein